MSSNARLLLPTQLSTLSMRAVLIKPVDENRNPIVLSEGTRIATGFLRQRWSTDRRNFFYTHVGMLSPAASILMP